MILSMESLGSEIQQVAIFRNTSNFTELTDDFEGGDLGKRRYSEPRGIIGGLL